jgi:orotate phosphoribosyltransferase
LGTDYVDSAGVSAIITSDVDAAFINALTIDADTLGGQNSAYHLDYGNFTNTPTIPSFGNDYVDSAQVVALVDSDYVQARAIEADPVGTAVAMAIALG